MYVTMPICLKSREEDELIEIETDVSANKVDSIRCLHHSCATYTINPPIKRSLVRPHSETPINILLYY